MYTSASVDNCNLFWRLSGNPYETAFKYSAKGINP